MRLAITQKIHSALTLPSHMFMKIAKWKCANTAIKKKKNPGTLSYYFGKILVKKKSPTFKKLEKQKRDIHRLEKIRKTKSNIALVAKIPTLKVKHKTEC